MRKTILGASSLLALAGLVACGPKEPQPAQPRPKVTITVAGRETQPQPVLTRFGDCGDDAPPCITYDDGAQGDGIYLMMPSHPPTLLTVCDVEDYPTNLPCVYGHQDLQDRWILVTPDI